MNPNVPIGNQKEQVKSYRQLKSEELEGLVLDLESNSMKLSEQKRLIAMLNRSADNLTETWDEWMIEEKTLIEITDSLTETFFHLQDIFELIDEDKFENEWRCDFSNRLMHKSMRLQNFKKQLIQTQKTIYNALGELVDDSFLYIVDKSNGTMDLKDFNFYVKLA